MAQRFYRYRFTWLAYLLLAFCGYFLNVLGPITPFLKGELELSYTVSSLHFTAFAVGILVIGLSGHTADSAGWPLVFPLDRSLWDQYDRPNIAGRSVASDHHWGFILHGAGWLADPGYRPFCTI